MRDTLATWLQPSYRQFLERVAAGRAPHAVLLTGPAGLGKGLLVEAWVRFLLCRGEQRPCGECQGCHLLTAETHPDYYRVGLLDDKSIIGVDQIRELGEKLTEKSSQGGWKIAVIQPADAMNANAANSLLKTLEEPTPATMLILVSARPAELPATIRSRCQTVALNAPPTREALAWLAERSDVDPQAALRFANGAPMAALDLLESGFEAQRREHAAEMLALLEGKVDPVAIAADWCKGGAAEAVLWLSSWVQDVIRIAHLGDGGERVTHADALSDLQTVAGRIHLNSLHIYHDAVERTRRQLTGQINEQLAVEALLIAWARQLDRDSLERIA